MSAVRQFFDALSEEDLRTIISELRELEETGVLAQGRTRELALELAELHGLTARDALSLAQREPLRMAAYLWAAQQQPRERPVERSS